MKNIYLLITIFILLTGCSKESENGGSVIPPEQEPDESEEVILGANTVSITQNLTDHVVIPVNGMEITLDSSIKESDLPKQGQILLQTKVSEEFPSGFLGKVSKVEKNTTGYKIQTEKAYLDEAFEKLKVEEEMEIDLSGLADTRANNEIEIGGYESDGYKGFHILYTKNFLAGKSSAFKFDYANGFIFQYTIDINNKAHKPFASFTLKQKTVIKPSVELKLSENSGEEVTLFKQNLKSFPLVPKASPGGVVAEIILKPEIEINLFAKAKGECNLTSSIAFETSSVMGFVYKDGKSDFNWRSDKETDPAVTASAEFSMDGSIYAGLECAIKAKLFSENLLCLNIPFSIGPQISANLSVNAIQKNRYEELSNACITYTPLLGRAEAELKIFKGLTSQDPIEEGSIKGTIEKAFGEEKKFYLLPKFNNMSFERGSQDKKTATVVSNVQQDLLFPIQIAYRLTSDNGNTNNTPEWREYAMEKDMPSQFSHEYDGLKIAWNYKVVPIVWLPLFGEIEASPKKEIKGEIVVTTKEATSQDNTLILLGEFDPEIPQEPKNYGFCYSTTNSIPTINDEKVTANIHTNGVFSASFLINNDATYYYRAYIIAEDGIYYGEVRTYGSIIGKWLMKQQEDVYTLVSTGESTTYLCQHPATIEFKEDGSGMQIGAHSGGSDDTGDGDSDLDWNPTVQTNFLWKQDGSKVTLDLAGTKIQGTILYISNTELKLSYPISTIPEEKAVRTARYTRISQ